MNLDIVRTDIGYCVRRQFLPDISVFGFVILRARYKYDNGYGMYDNSPADWESCLLKTRRQWATFELAIKRVIKILEYHDPEFNERVVWSNYQYLYNEKQLV